MTPPQPFLGTITARSALVWLFLHGVSWVGGGAGGVAYPESLLGPPVSAGLICAVVIGVMRVELWRRSELVFLANLGCSFTRVGALIAAECVGLETALRLTLA